MKKLFLLTLLAMIMVGCENTTENTEAPLGSNMFSQTYQTIIIDSCEYIEAYHRLAHKGNCRFCLERQKKIIKEQIDSALIQKFD